ncbi:molybdopterin-dependent oxidoreductase [Nocardioides panacisoli]|uniref:molybdopterin-dependent oxidoreductase n=1 Tax=Nocardioides panacisoli TaxID=627624 RepID=UPI001C632C92|nr:molybdopterin-dependent oxidoreductase [Nocardioides panacisoli]QYJ03171.1 molybdopterin-dependent oxidoreductase [Nocardioides panacisoli]
MRTQLRWAGYGVLATLVGVGLAHLVAAALDPASSPVLAVGSAVIDLTPTPVKEWAIATFGTADKPILIGSVMAGVLLVSAVAGILARRRFALGAGLLLVEIGIASLAVVTNSGFVVLDLVPTVVAAIVGVAALAWLVRAHQQAEADQSEQGGRRGVLLAMGALGATAAVGGGVGEWLGRFRRAPENIALPDPVETIKSLPRGLERMVQGITPFRTANKDFYRVDTRLDTPVVDSVGWTLTIDGDVDQEVTITFDELLEMPMIERDITMTCVSNSVGGEFVGAARWLGVRLTDVLELAGVGDRADQILSTDFDGMTISTPLEMATDGRDAMIVVGMNGEQLPRAHGFPVRMVIPGLYGFISATKWLTRLTLTTYADTEAYWTERDWAIDAPIKPSARIDTPKALSNVDAGEVLVGGVAWAQNDGGVDKVQVRVDGGEWQDAELGPTAGEIYWRQWFFRWEADSGSHRIAARTLTGDGATQTAERAEPFPSGSSGIHEFIVNVA